MKKLLHWFLLSCKKATELIDKKSFVPLSIKEKLQLRLHKTICDACTAYEKQSLHIDGLMHKHVHHASKENATILTNESLKEKIISNLPGSSS